MGGSRRSSGVLAGALRAAGLVVAGAVGVLGAELAWVVHRDLPSFEGADASGRFEPAGAPPGDPPLVVAALGDSTLTGPGLDDVRELWLWQAIEAIAPGRSVEVRSLAVGGSRAADVRRRVGSALAVRPDVAVVAVGSNDAIHGTPRRELARDLHSIARELRAAGVVVAMANVGDLGNLERVPDPLARVLRVRAQHVRAQIEAVVAQEPGVVLLDVAASDAAFRQGGVFVADRFHPNAAGHAAWARCAVDGLREAIERAEGARA